jgi:hypothetical protein
MSAPIPRNSVIPQRRYRVRLYGQTADDPHRFFKNLGVILRTDEAGARQIMRQAPVVVKEGVDKQTGEALLGTLRMIQALCLLEPMNGEEPEPDSVNRFVMEALKEAQTDGPVEKQDSYRPNFSTALAMAGTTLFAFLVVLPFLPSSSGPQRIPTKFASISNVRMAAAVAPYQNTSPMEIRDRMDDLALENQEIREILEAKRDALKSYRKQWPAPDWKDVRLMKGEVMSLQNELSSNLRNIRKMERRLRAIELAQRFRGQS